MSIALPMTKKTPTPHIPYDVYESPQEIVIVIPLWGVDKKSIDISLRDYRIIIQGNRQIYDFKDDLMPLKQDCYRGPIQIQIDLPPQVYFDKIHSTLTPENILEITVPKSIIPEKIAIEIQYDA
jgi:HSP20 family molecular chaperone IbpA